MRLGRCQGHTKELSLSPMINSSGSQNTKPNVIFVNPKKHIGFYYSISTGLVCKKRRQNS